MNNLDKICATLAVAYPTTTYANSMNGEAFTDFDWVDNPITEAEFDAAITNKSYILERRLAYDNLNQLELISDDAINGTTTHADAILAIKAEFPKPV